MAGTYGDLQAAVAADLLRDDLATQIANKIQDAITFWEAERFSFNERKYTITTVQGQEYYDLKDPTLKAYPSGSVGAGEIVLEIDSMTCKPLGSGKPFVVTGETQQWFDRYQTNPTVAQGLPYKYAIYDDQLRIFPTPNGAHLLTISALARLQALTVGADANDWMTEGAALIRETAKLFICRDVIRDQAGVQAAMLALYGDGNMMPGYVSTLKRKASAKNMVGRQRASSL